METRLRPEDAHRLVPGRLVLRHRDRGLAGHPAPAHLVVEGLDVDADGGRPGVVQFADPGQVAGWLALHLDRQAGHRLQDGAHATATRFRAPRSGPVVVPVVMTICLTPSSRTAASATSASCAGVLAATVAPERSDSSMVQKRQRSASA